MADILGHANSHKPDPQDARGYVGTRYKATPLPSPEELRAEGERQRAEIELEEKAERAGEVVLRTADTPSLLDGFPKTTTRPGCWF